VSDIAILTEATELQAFAERLALHPIVAIDLEADSMHHYQEQVCLLQVTAGEETLLIDPLKQADLEPLRAVLANPAQRKLFHAADYDLRCLRRDFGLEVDGLFDTMVASQFCGEEKFGLADLLAKYFGVELDKKFQRADWTIRPLPEGMIRYAAEDTRHLEKLAALLETRLVELGRLDWVAEECRLLEQVAFEVHHGPLFLRFKGAGKLDRRQLAVLEGLLAWRDREAQRRDVPPFKVLGNQALQSLATTSPQTLRGMNGLEGLFPRLIDRYGKALLEVIAAGLSVPDAELPVFPRGPRQQRDPDVEQRMKRLKEWRSDKAAALQLDAGIMINNALLEQLARRQPKGTAELEQVPGLKNWQRREFGAEMLECLKGS